jgi:hypothetical protein
LLGRLLIIWYPRSLLSVPVLAARKVVGHCSRMGLARRSHLRLRAFLVNGPVRHHIVDGRNGYQYSQQAERSLQIPGSSLGILYLGIPKCSSPWFRVPRTAHLPMGGGVLDHLACHGITRTRRNSTTCIQQPIISTTIRRRLERIHMAARHQCECGWILAANKAKLDRSASGLSGLMQ